MKNAKFVIIFSAFGFLLSFICGLISHSGFGHIILTAFIFLLVFTALGFGIQFVFEKILEIDTSFSNDDVSGSSIETAGVSRSQNQNKHIVDLVISEEAFPKDDSETEFFVGTNHQMLTENDLNHKKTDDNQKTALENSSFSDTKVSKNPSESLKQSIKDANSSSAQGFVPVQLGGESPKNVSSKEAVTEFKNKSDSKISSDSVVGSGNASETNQDDSLDVLPDMDDITSLGSGSASTSSSNDEGDDSGEESYVSSSGNAPKDANEIAEGQDAALMAKAISTLLSKDS